MKVIFIALLLSCSMLSFSERAVVDHGLCAVTACHPVVAAAMVPVEDDPVGLPFVLPFEVSGHDIAPLSDLQSDIVRSVFTSPIRAPPFFS